MSLTLALLDTTTQLTAVPADAQLLAGGCADAGALECVNQKSAEAQGTTRNVSTMAAIVFVLISAWKSRGAMAATIVAGLAAGIFVWIVYNVTAIKDATDKEINGLGAVSTSSTSSMSLASSMSSTSSMSLAWPAPAGVSSPDAGSAGSEVPAGVLVAEGGTPGAAR